jgi:hypothetical protein
LYHHAIAKLQHSFAEAKQRYATIVHFAMDRRPKIGSHIDIAKKSAEQKEVENASN